MRACILATAAVFLVAGSSGANTLSFSGALQHDDELVTFHYSVQNQGAVTVQTTSFATGGFIPILSLFDSSGIFLFWSDGYSLNADASLDWVSDAGAQYTIILSEYDNYPLGNLTDGYTRDGQGDFTTQISGFPGPFRDPGGAQLTGDWAVSFTSADSNGLSVPEPGTAALLLAGLLMVGCGIWRRAGCAKN